MEYKREFVLCSSCQTSRIQRNNVGRQKTEETMSSEDEWVSDDSTEESCYYENEQLLQHQLEARRFSLGNSKMKDNAWKTILTRSLHRAWVDKTFTDIEIETQDETIPAHKVVLAVASPYFRALLDSHLRESQTNVIKLNNVKGRTMKVVLTYAYCGKAHLTSENSFEILALADYFQIYDLKRLCCRFIKIRLIPTSCLPTYEMASLHQCSDLSSYAFQKALKHCSEAIKAESFLNLKPETLVALFKQQILDINSEDELFQALITWTSHANEERQDWFPTLLSLLNEEQMNPAMRDAFLEKTEEVRRGSVEEKVVDVKYKTQRHKKEEDLLIVFGGESEGRILGVGECFALGYTKWRCSIPLAIEEVRDLNKQEGQQVIPPMNEPRTYAASTCKDNVVYLIGGRNSCNFLKSCETYHVSANQWSSLPDLPTAVHGSAATFFQDNLFVVGGKNSSETENSVLMYDRRKEEWSFKKTMNKGRVHLGIGVAHGCLYAVGGFSKSERDFQKNRYLLSCEKYDIETNTWTPVASLKQCRAYHGVAVIDDYLYAIGGYDGVNWLSSVERYDPLKDRWTNVCSMIGRRSSFGITVSFGRIYCIGGFSGDSVLNTVEKYNSTTDMWHCVHSMQLRRCGLSAATLKLPSEKLTTKKYTTSAD